MVISFTFFVSIAYAQTGTGEYSRALRSRRFRVAKGAISVGLYTSAENFPETEKSYNGRIIKVTGEKAVAVFQDIPAGTYAIAVFHDTNSNSKLDTNFFGIPKGAIYEGYAFSNNVFGTFGPPDFEEVTFKLDGDKTVEIKMEY